MISALFLYNLQISPTGSLEAGQRLSLSGILMDMRGGVAYIFRVPTLRTIAVVNLINIFAFGPAPPVAIVYYQSHLGMTAEQYGFLASAGFIGLTVGTVLAGSWIKHLRPGRTYALGQLLMGIITILIALTPWITLIYGWSFLRSLGNGLITVAYATFLQSHAVDEQRGRVFSMMNVVSESARPLAILAGTSLAELIGPRGGPQIVLGLTGAIFLVTALMTASARSVRSSDA